MPDIKIQQRNFNVTTAASGTQDVTITSFGTVKAAIVYYSGATGLNAETNSFNQGMGFSDGTNQSSMASFVNEGETTGDSTRSHSTNSFIDILSINQTVTASFSVTFITDGIQLTVENQADVGYLCHLVLIGGADVSNVFVGSKDDLGTGTGDVAITGVGFEPDLILMTTVGLSTAVPATSVHNIFSLGCAINDGSQTQRVSMMSSQDNLSAPASEVTAYIGNDSITGRALWAGPGFWDALLKTFDAGGFTVTTSASSVNAIVNYLCLKFTGGPNLALFDMEFPTAGNYAETTPGFEPTFGLISNVLGPTARNTSTTGNVGWALTTITDEPKLRTMCAVDEHNQTTTDASNYMNNALSILAPVGGAFDVVASTWSMDSLGWDFTLTTNPPVNPSLGWALAIGTKHAIEVAKGPVW